MTVGAIAVAILLGIAVLLVFVCSVAVLVMRDAYQKLHYIAPPATVSALLVAVAVLVGERQKEAGLKALLVWVLLTLMNAVITHATARAARIRALGHLNVAPGEQIEVVSHEEPLRGTREGEEVKQ